MMKYLIIGDANSMHIFNYVNKLLDRTKFEVSLMTLSTERVREEYRNYYKENNITLYSIAEKYGDNLPNKTKAQRVKNFILKYRLSKALPKFDICHIHSVYKTSMLFYLLNKRKFKHLITSYWGGDILDKSKLVIKLREKCFKRADVITVTTKRLLEEFREVHGEKFDSKLNICRFATDGLEHVKSLYEKKGVEGCKDLLSFPKNKFCITVGYSAYAEQHQDLIINKIATLDNEIKQKLFICIPMQYGRYNQKYIDDVKVAARKCGCEYVVLEEYASFENKAAEAIATDLYFNMRDSDAFSNTLKEQVCAGTTVVIGSWLKYYELEDMRADVVVLNSFEEVPQTVVKYFNTNKEKSFFSPIYEMYSSEAVKKQWNDVIRFALKEN